MGDNETKTKEDTVTKDGHGDLKLIVGGTRDGTWTRTFTVWARVLRLASPVWNAMLDQSNNFSEASENEIEFLDDDPEAFLLVLRIAHLNYTNIPQTLTDEQALELAVLCDKYDTVALVKPFAQLKSWIQCAKDRHGTRTPKESTYFKETTLLTWYYVIGDATSFQHTIDAITYDIHISTKGETLYQDKKLPELPIEGLEEHLIKKRQRTFDALTEKIRELCHELILKKSCKRIGESDQDEKFSTLCTAAMLRSLFQSLNSNNIPYWLLTKSPVKFQASAGKFLSKITEMKIVSPLLGHSNCNTHMSVRLKEKFPEAAVSAMKEVGLPEHMANHSRDQDAK